MVTVVRRKKLKREEVEHSLVRRVLLMLERADGGGEATPRAQELLHKPSRQLPPPAGQQAVRWERGCVVRVTSEQL